MKSTRIHLITLILVWVMVIGFSTTALAAPSLQWQTDRLYYNYQGEIVIEGYYFNNGTQTITWVNWQELKVYFRLQNTDWWLQTKATFENLNVYLNPGETVRRKFIIYNVNYSYCDYWNVVGTANYNYR